MPLNSVLYQKVCNARVWFWQNLTIILLNPISVLDEYSHVNPVSSGGLEQRETVVVSKFVNDSKNNNDLRVQLVSEKQIDGNTHSTETHDGCFILHFIDIDKAKQQQENGVVGSNVL